MYTRQDYLDHKCTHSEYFAQFVNDMQKRIILSRWAAKELARAWENDESFNTHSTPIAQWDRLSCPTDHRLLDELGEYSTPSTRVCILKEAARQIVMDHYETYGRRYDRFRYKIVYIKNDPKDNERYGTNEEATDRESLRRAFERAHPECVFLSATKYSKHNAVADMWERITNP